MQRKRDGRLEDIEGRETHQSPVRGHTKRLHKADHKKEKKPPGTGQRAQSQNRYDPESERGGKRETSRVANFEIPTGSFTANGGEMLCEASVILNNKRYAVM